LTFWYVFTTAPNKERPAAQELGRRGWLVNVPLDPRAKRKRRNGNKRQALPAIPGYVLIFMEPDEKSITRILRAEFPDGERCVNRRVPGKVTAGEMLEFLEFLSAMKEVSSVKQSVKPGDHVRLKYGAGEGQIVPVVSVKGAKVNILIELFNATRVVEVKADAVQLEKDATSPSIPLHKDAKQCTTLRRDGGRFATGGKSRIDRQCYAPKPRLNTAIAE
jgi:transcription antitermination factor NusG